VAKSSLTNGKPDVLALRMHCFGLWPHSCLPRGSVATWSRCCTPNCPRTAPVSSLVVVHKVCRGGRSGPLDVSRQTVYNWATASWTGRAAIPPAPRGCAALRPPADGAGDHRSAPRAVIDGTSRPGVSRHRLDQWLLRRYLREVPRPVRLAPERPSCPGTPGDLLEAAAPPTGPAADTWRQSKGGSNGPRGRCAPCC